MEKLCTFGPKLFFLDIPPKVEIWTGSGFESQHKLCFRFKTKKGFFQASKPAPQWKFNPPSAPHHGGAGEKLVRSFKHTFYAILGNRRMTDEILSTFFRIVEQSLIDRPLDPASADATEFDALTPNNFLLGLAGKL